jgi:membrane protease YdiL (CAAX protease family)
MPVFVLGTLSILALLAWGTYQTAVYLRYVTLTFNPLLMPAENILRVALIAACVWLGAISGLPHQALGWLAVDPGRDVALGLGVGIIIAIVIPILTQVAIKNLGPQIYSPVVVRSVLPRTRREWLLIPLALVGTVLLEELLFRSLLLGGFGQMAPPILLAVVWSALFGAMHLPQGSLGIAVAAIMGLLLSALFLSTMSILAPLVAHYMINLLQLVWASLDRGWLDRYKVPNQPPAGY